MTQNDPPIVVFATLPPPVNGLHLATRLVVDFLKEMSPVLVFDCSAGENLTGFRWRLVKGIRSLLAPLKLIQWRLRNCTILYTVANGNGGLYYNMLTVVAARVMGYRCILHHHTYIYLASPDLRMSIINRLLGSNGTHVVLAPEMETRFREVYGGRSKFNVLPNYYVMKTFTGQVCESESAANRTFRIGHISNLTFAKGLRHVVQTFEALNQTHNVELKLAGPLMGSEERAVVDDLIQRFPDRVTYLGAVYDKEKECFYSGIDVLLFPSEMDEAQPLVILEAFEFGKPTIAYGKGCIPSMIGNDGGHVIPFGTEFAATARDFIARWIDYPETHDLVCQQVRNKAKRLRSESLEQLEEFYRCVQGQPAIEKPTAVLVKRSSSNSLSPDV